MKRISGLASVLLLWACAFTESGNVFACTIVTLARGNQVIIGNNEDWTDPQTKMWFNPAAAGEYGRVCFGFSRDFGVVQGGINDQGLFLDANALAPTGWRPDSSKPLFDENINDYILAHCATVDEAVAFFKKYSVFLGGGKFVIADARGESVVVEWADGEDRFSRRSGFYQISTNIPQWNIVPGKVADERYNIAEKVILGRNEVSVPAVRAALAATHKEWSYPTIYSYICDLKNLKVTVYDFHNFEEAFEFDLAAELKKGKKSYDIPALFPIKTYAAVAHGFNGPKLGIAELQEKLAAGGLENAIRWYEEVKDKVRKLNEYVFYEFPLQELGLDLMDKNKLPEALNVFKFNAHIFPDSSDAWEMLGDACLKSGDAKQAGTHYEKSLQLDPENGKVKEKLSALKPPLTNKHTASLQAGARPRSGAFIASS